MEIQHLWGPGLASPEEVVGWLGALQAQEFAFARWSVGQRAGGVDDAAVDGAFDDGLILRTHILRPTWHFVLPADLPWMLTANGARVQARNAYQYRNLGLDDKVFEMTNSVIAKALKGRHLTRKEIAVELERVGIDSDGQRLAYIVMRAELDSVVTSGPRRGKQHTYARFDERVPKGPTPDPDEALAELTRRYFTSRGPATLKDFVQWASMTVADAKRGLEMVGPELEREVIDELTYWSGPGPRPAKRTTTRVNLVQVYDETVMGYSESRSVLQAEIGSRQVPSVNSLMHPILLDGQMIGHWRPRRGRDSVEIETTFYRPLKPKEQAALEAEVGRYGRFLGIPVTA